MAQLIETRLTCDVHDGDAVADGTTTLTLNGRSVEVDLCTDHFNELHGAVEPFLIFGRPVATKAAKSGAKKGANHAFNQEVRAWAAKNGHELGVRGRIPASIVAEYEAAQSKKK